MDIGKTGYSEANALRNYLLDSLIPFHTMECVQIWIIVLLGQITQNKNWCFIAEFYDYLIYNLLKLFASNH